MPCGAVRPTKTTGRTNDWENENDWENVAAEIESAGMSEQREIDSRLAMRIGSP